MTTSTLTRPQAADTSTITPPTCIRLARTGTPRASDGGCPQNGGADSCPADQSKIDQCSAC